MRIAILCFVFCLVQHYTHAQAPTVKWTYDLRDQAFGQPCARDVDGDGKLELFFSTYRNDGYIYCLNAENGTLKWKNTFPGEVGSCMDAGPLIFDSANNGKFKIIVPGSCNYSTKCLDANTGVPLWSTDIGGSDSPPSMADIDGDGKQDLLMGNFLGYEYCMDPFTGNIKWKIAVDTSNFVCVNTEPVIVKNADGPGFIVGTAWAAQYNPGVCDKIDCYRGSDHKLRWRHYVHNTVYEGGAVGDLYRDGKTQIVIGNWDDSLFNIDVETGKKNWAVQYGSFYMSAVTLADLDNDGYLNIIYNDGPTIFALKPDGSILWKYDGTYIGSLRGSVAADVNNDKYLDVTFCTYGGYVTSLSGIDGSVIKSVDLNALYGNTFNTDCAPVIADFDADGILDILVIGGYTQYPDTAGNYGRAYCFSWGVGKGPAWTTFRHDERRTGCLCDDKGLPLLVPSVNEPGSELHAGCSVFPNPAEHDLTIKFDRQPIPAHVSIAITDVAGRTLLTDEKDNNRQVSLVTSIRELPAGTYLARVTADGTVYVNMFVKK